MKKSFYRKIKMAIYLNLAFGIVCLTGFIVVEPIAGKFILGVLMLYFLIFSLLTFVYRNTRMLEISDSEIEIYLGAPWKQSKVKIPINEVQSVHPTSKIKTRRVPTKFGDRWVDHELEVIEIKLKNPLEIKDEKIKDFLTKDVPVINSFQADNDLKKFYILQEPRGGFANLLSELQKMQI